MTPYLVDVLILDNRLIQESKRNRYLPHGPSDSHLCFKYPWLCMLIFWTGVFFRIKPFMWLCKLFIMLVCKNIINILVSN